MKKGVFVFWSIFVAAALFRLWQSFGIKPPDIGKCLKQVINGTGVISEEPQLKEKSQILIVTASIPCSDSELWIRINTKLYPRFSYGDQVSFKGKLLEPMNFESEGRTFDYQSYLAKDDIYYEMKSATVGPFVSDLSAHKSIITKITSSLFAIKSSFVSVLKKTLGEPHAALAAGLVVGEKSALGKDLLEDFRRVGLIHIVVLSGYNITIVAVALKKLLSFLPRAWGIAAGGICIALFGILVGGGATVVRSCFMAGIALSADLIRRDYNVVRALLFAGLVMLIENPMILLHDTSFQLSFLATLGLIILASPIENRLSFIPDKFGMRGIVASTLATQIFVSPFILYTMGQISIIGMIVNILVLPLIPMTMLFVFLTGAVGLIWLPLSQIIAWLAHILLSYEIFMVKNFARLPFAAERVPAFSVWWVIAFYGLFIATLITLQVYQNSQQRSSSSRSPSKNPL